MSYTPTTWTTGDTITASALNKIENGIAGAGSALICTSSYDDNEGNYVLDKTVQEIYDALLAGTPVYIKYQYGVLGAQGTGTYESHTYLAPVIKIFGYSYTDNIRICASKPNNIGSKDTKNFLLSPAVAIYSASGMNEYPEYYDTILVPNANVSTGGGMS